MDDALKCPKCGADNPKDNKFCDTCGYKVAVKPQPKKTDKREKTKKKPPKKEEEQKNKPAETPGAGARPAYEETPGVKFGGIALNWEVVVWLLIIILAAISRFAVLGDKPMHHDESMHAFYSWKLFKGMGYSYNPMLHGPFLFHANAFIYWIFGASDYTARVMPALYGMMCIVILWWFKPYLGRMGAAAAALLMAVSPAFMYQSRYIRNDIYIAGDTLIMLLGLLKFFDTKKPFWLYFASAGLALSWATKENTYITGFIFFTFFVVWWVWEYYLKTNGEEEEFEEDDKIHSTLGFLFRTKKGIKVFVNALLLFVIIHAFLFYGKQPNAGFWTNLKGIWDGYTASLIYWLGQHEVERGSQPKSFYILITLFYEHITVFFGLIASVFYLLKKERRTFINLFLVYWWIVALFIYSWAGERMPWLMLHPLLPMLLLAGKFCGEMFQKKEWSWQRPAGIAVFVFLTLSTLSGAINVSFYGKGASPKESLVYVQSSTDTLKVVEKIETVARALKAEKWASNEFRSYDIYDIEMSIEDYCSWPFAWYLREYNNIAYPPRNIPKSAKGKKAIILSGIEEASRGHDERVRKMLEDEYVYQRFHLREWWAPDNNKWKNAPPGEKIKMLFDRVVYRDVWSPLGAYDFVVYVRKDIQKYWWQ
ncbi:MAG: flippase activity-associated protein Agl23 [Candidatus Goldiibacteriota bacterium]